MKLLNKLYLFFVNNPLKAAVFFILILVIILSSVLYIKNYSENANNSSSTNSVGVNLKEYDSIRQKIGVILEDNNSSLNPTNRDRITKRLSILEDNKTTSETGYKAIQEIGLFIAFTYSETNDPNYRKLSSEIGVFAKTNFPKLYNKFDFELVCQDTTCAELPQPTEILGILEEIKKSDLPQEIKDNLITNIRNTGYLPEKKKHEKVSLYYLDLADIKRYSSLSKSGSTDKIYSLLETFLISNYPEEYAEIKNIPEATPPPIKKD